MSVHPVIRHDLVQYNLSGGVSSETYEQSNEQLSNGLLPMSNLRYRFSLILPTALGSGLYPIYTLPATAY